MKRVLILAAFLFLCSTKAHAQLQVPSYAADPVTCSPTIGLMYYNTGTQQFKSCTSVNTWSLFAGGGSITGCTTTNGLLYQNGLANTATCSSIVTLNPSTGDFTIGTGGTIQRLYLVSGSSQVLLSVSGPSGFFQITTPASIAQFVLGAEGGNALGEVIGNFAVQAVGNNPNGMYVRGAASTPTTPPLFSVGWVAPSNNSFTSYGLQFSATAPGGNFMQCATPSSGISACTWDTLLLDNGTTLSYSGTGGISATGGPVAAASDGTHAGYLSLLGNTTAPSLIANSFSWIGPNSASFTAWAAQMQSTSPSSAGLLKIGAVSGGIAQATVATQYVQWLACDGKGLGDGLNAIPAGTYLESTCKNTTGVTVTITGVQCLTDNAGSSTLNAAGNSLGALLTGAITCGTSYVAGTQSANVALTNGDYIKFTFVADGTTKQTDWVVTGTY